MNEVHTTYGRAIYAAMGLTTTMVGMACLTLVRHGASAWDVALVWTLIGLVMLGRSLRMGLTFDEHTLTIRGVTRTRCFDRAHASLLTDDTLGRRSAGLSVPRIRASDRIHPIYEMNGMTGWSTARNKTTMLELPKTH